MMKSIRYAVGLRIKDQRDRLGLSQRKLANLIGISYSVVSRLENGGEASFSVDDLASYAIALGCELRDLIPERLDNGEYK